jgi:hypothetical protein
MSVTVYTSIQRCEGKEVRTLTEEQSQPELLGLQVLERMALALRVSFENRVASSYSLQRCAGMLVSRARGDLSVLGVDSLGDCWSGVDIFALAKVSLGIVRLLLCHLEVRLYRGTLIVERSRNPKSQSGAFQS